MSVARLCIFNCKCSVILLKRCLTFSTLVNQNLKLKALQPTTCIRKYSLTYDEEERSKKLTPRVILVNVITPDKKVSSLTLEQAQRMAKRRGLLMTKLSDPPKFASFGDRDVYEMFTRSELVKQSADSIAEFSDDAELKKETKTLNFSATIGVHDLNFKLKQAKKWLSKRHVVIIILADDGTEDGMKEKTALIHAQLQDISEISMGSKKKQLFFTLRPRVDTPKTKEESTKAPDAA